MFENKENQAHTQVIPKTDMEPTFFGKVMFFFGLAVFSSAAGTYVAGTYFLEYFIAYPALMWGAFIAELVLVFTSRLWSQKAVLNKLLFVVFAVLTGITVAPIIGILLQNAAGTSILIKALGATALMFTATALIGWTTKYDLSGLRGFLFMGLIGLIIVGVLGMFFPWGNTMEMVYSGVGVLLFSGFTMYDIQKLKQYPEDRYIDAALKLYLDIFNLFLMILRLIMAFGRD